VEIPTFSPVMASMIGLGVGIDYALVVLSRHRENLASGMAVVEAAGRAVGTAGQAVVFAGGTVVIAILGLAVAGLPFMTAAAIGISMVVFIMVVASITLLPAFLGLVGMRVNRRADRKRDVSAPVDLSRRWRRWGSHVSRHAWSYTIGVTILLLALTAPVLALQLGFPDEGSLPESRTERRAYDLVADGFGPGANGPLLVAVDLAGDDSVVGPLAAAIEADPGIASVALPAVDGAAEVAVITAIPATPPQDDATFDTVTRLRSEIFPDVLGESPASAHVGGQTANFADLGNRVADRLPFLIIAVVTLSFLLLTVVFRSVVVALKAAVLNLLSIGAAYGVLVMVFQWGWGADLIGLEGTVPIVSFVPMMMFAVLFGLSMDYEVFLLSRVREEYVRTGDNDTAVIRGLSGTARVITSAALIMVSVFSGFVLGEDPVIKMMGLGLAVAILVDASIVRMILVPASMTLMGDANWWLPKWLDRWLPHIDLDGVDELAPRELPEPVDVDDTREPVLVN
jgi:RND superfamily putative drug exporter